MPMHILIVDDEALARLRLRTLLGDAAAQEKTLHQVQEADNAQQALALLQRNDCEPIALVLLDIHMPGLNGLELARTVRALPSPPAIVFVTAHASHAVQAFELDAIDYLTKPVRLERLVQALNKVERATSMLHRSPAESGPTLLVPDRGSTIRLPLHEVLYCKAELKYVTVRTVNRNYIVDTALSELESRYCEQLLRVHRNALVSRTALRSLERSFDSNDQDGWNLRLHGVPELLAVSRRQLPQVRAALRA